MKGLFGTDGIGAVAGRYPLDQPTITGLAGWMITVITEYLGE